MLQRNKEKVEIFISEGGNIIYCLYSFKGSLTYFSFLIFRFISDIPEMSQESDINKMIIWDASEKAAKFVNGSVCHKENTLESRECKHIGKKDQIYAHV